MKREGINYPKFKDQFALMDFEAEPLPALSLYPVPKECALADWELTLTGLAGERCTIGRQDLRKLPRVREKSPLVCQIFNWSEEPEVEGVRLVDLLKVTGIDSPEDGYFSFYSADGLYFEGLPRSIARDPRTLLVFGINLKPLPTEFGGPLRLWVPFLQGYKSVKWLQTIRAFRKDPVGIKRFLGQSRTAVLGADGQERAGVVVARPSNGETSFEI
ncbi:MAG: molybdopterin-dependent oxidoreductase [SAR202 cluster bacterium]|nr:molybdopterin-dependent oxidoreductase [SAR202 cluster bacterium]